MFYSYNKFSVTDLTADDIQVRKDAEMRSL